MPSILTAQDFSDYEFCPRLVQLGKTVEPISWPVRHAVKRYLLEGVRHLVAGESTDLVCWEVPAAFLDEAGERGYQHAIPLMSHDRNAYTLIRDYACWLEGALRIVAELGLELEPAAPAYVDEVAVMLDCWIGRLDPSTAHTFRVASRPEPEAPTRWLELLASLDSTISRIIVHTFILPAAVKDRLPSPLCIAYSHPMTGHMRLAIRTKEKGVFTQSWKRIARWETESTGEMDVIGWAEWRKGIERDECLGKCYQANEIDLEDVGAGFRRSVMKDARQIAKAMNKSGEAVRKRELCPRCHFLGWCHGDKQSRQGYRSISAPEDVPVSPVAVP